VNLLRCANYTRKSTEHEHGPRIYFARCPTRRLRGLYKEPYPSVTTTLPISGGNLNRPTLKMLLADIEARKTMW
jgi:hypothetical protein